MCKMKCSFYEKFEGQVHQVSHLCTREARRRWGTFPAMTRVLVHICVRTVYAKSIFQEESVRCFGSPGVRSGTSFLPALKILLLSPPGLPQCYQSAGNGCLGLPRCCQTASNGCSDLLWRHYGARPQCGESTRALEMLRR